MNARLKQLRAAAHPPISIREMAEKLGISHATYHNYERPAGFKARFLPMDVTRRIARILADRGVNPDDVLALAGIGIDERSGIDLSEGEGQLIDNFRQLDADQRRLLLELAESMNRGAPKSATIHSERVSFHSHPKEHV